jgi:hypothetical protein
MVFLSSPFDDAISNRFLKMPDQHALRDPWNGTLEFAGASPRQISPRHRDFPDFQILFEGQIHPWSFGRLSCVIWVVERIRGGGKGGRKPHCDSDQ